MTALAQIRHVAAKDVRQTRWVLLLYVALVALATATAAQLPGFSVGFFDGWLPLLVLTGMLIVAFAVQSDSPTRTGALWTTRPLLPGAVLGAKLAFTVIALMIVPVIGEAIGLHQYGLEGGALVRAGSSSALLYGELLLAAALVAALTRDLWTYIVAFIIIAVVAELASVLPAEPTASLAGGNGMVLYWGTRAAATVACVAALAVLYRRRDARRGAIAFGFAAVVVLIASLFMPAPAPRALPVEGPVVSVPAQRADSAPIAGTSRFDVLLDVDALAGVTADRLVLGRATAHISLADGSSVDIPIRQNFDLRGVSSRVGGVRWFELPFAGYPRHLPIQIFVDPAQRATLAASRVTGIRIDGEVTAFTGRVVAPIPPRPGALLRIGGRTYTIDAYEHSAAGASLDVSSRWIDTAAAGRASFPRGAMIQVEPTIALVREHDGQRQGIAPMSTGEESSNSSLVLPGPMVQIEHSHFGAIAPRGSALDARWFDDARLTAIDWTPIRRFAIRADVPVAER